MVTEPTNEIIRAAGYGPPGGGYGGPPGGGMPPGGGYGGPPPGAPPGGGYGGPPPGAPPGGGYGGPPPGGGFGPPPGGGFPGGGPMMPGAGGDVNTTLPLILGILSIFCCWPAAIFIIIFAVQAKNLKNQGQIEAARSKAKTATIVGWIIVGLGLLGWIASIIMNVAARS